MIFFESRVMGRKRWSFWSLVVLLTVIGSMHVRAEAVPPNVIFILADDLGYGDLSCFGQKKLLTPIIDRLAREGMKFTDHYSGNTVCSPSRACLMTGQHPCLLYTSPSPRDGLLSRMPSSA